MGKQSFKRWRWALPAILLCLCLYSCSAIFHEHEWQEATCAEARTCVGCGDREGEPLGHDWEEATCAAPKTCRRCGAVEGERIEHQWTPATCVEPELCVLCGQRRLGNGKRAHLPNRRGEDKRLLRLRRNTDRIDSRYPLPGRRLGNCAAGFRRVGGRPNPTLRDVRSGIGAGNICSDRRYRQC